MTKKKEAPHPPRPKASEWLQAPREQREATLELLAATVDNCSSESDLLQLLKITGKLIRPEIDAWSLYAQVMDSTVLKMVALVLADDEPTISWFYYRPEKVPSDLTGPPIPSGLAQPSGYIDLAQWTIFPIRSSSEA